MVRVPPKEEDEEFLDLFDAEFDFPSLEEELWFTISTKNSNHLINMIQECNGCHKWIREEVALTQTLT